jgi:hypothetical protein
MIVVERTHTLDADEAWLPPAVRRAKWAAGAAVTGGTGVAIAGALLVAPAIVVLWKGLVLAGIGASLLGKHVSRRAFHRQLRRMTQGQLALAELKHRAEGELVCVRGRIEAPQTLRGILLESTGVYRRMIFKTDRFWVHEAATDFDLLDESNHRITIHAAGARWLVSPREPMEYSGSRFAEEHVPAAVKERCAGHATVQAAELVLEPGELVQLVGYKSSVASVDGEVGDYRSPPQRPTLQSGPDLPLVITRVSDLDAE